MTPRLLMSQVGVIPSMCWRFQAASVLVASLNAALRSQRAAAQPLRQDGDGLLQHRPVWMTFGFMARAWLSFWKYERKMLPRQEVQMFIRTRKRRRSFRRTLQDFQMPGNERRTLSSNLACKMASHRECTCKRALSPGLLHFV